ncbi:VOC family protein [Micromonospora sp. NPDC001898]|uniref:VOC family protein n=1 Tax=Micromonospora sp. NPDC001898 TaxID=3364221 RepID=UPI0036BD808E
MAVTFDAHDTARLARFWAGMLGREVVAHAGAGVEAPQVRRRRRHPVGDRGVLPNRQERGWAAVRRGCSRRR